MNKMKRVNATLRKNATKIANAIDVCASKNGKRMDYIKKNNINITTSSSDYCKLTNDKFEIGDVVEKSNVNYVVVLKRSKANDNKVIAVEIGALDSDILTKEELVTEAVNIMNKRKKTPSKSTNKTNPSSFVEIDDIDITTEIELRKLINNQFIQREITKKQFLNLLKMIG